MHLSEVISSRFPSLFSGVAKRDAANSQCELLDFKLLVFKNA